MRVYWQIYVNVSNCAVLACPPTPLSCMHSSRLCWFNHIALPFNYHFTIALDKVWINEKEIIDVKKKIIGT